MRQNPYLNNMIGSNTGRYVFHNNAQNKLAKECTKLRAKQRVWEWRIRLASCVYSTSGLCPFWHCLPSSKYGNLPIASRVACVASIDPWWPASRHFVNVTRFIALKHRFQLQLKFLNTYMEWWRLLVVYQTVDNNADDTYC